MANRQIQIALSLDAFFMVSSLLKTREKHRNPMNMVSIYKNTGIFSRKEPD